MVEGVTDAAAVVSREVTKRPPQERGAFLRELLAHTAAAMVVVDGARATGEAVYRLADAVVARGDRRGA